MPESTTTASTLDHLKDVLGLRFPPQSVRSRDNLDPSEAVFIGDYVDPTRLEHGLSGRVFFCGSYTTNSYPVDSAEAASRSAHYAVERLLAANPALQRSARAQALLVPPRRPDMLSGADEGRVRVAPAVTTRQRRAAARVLSHPNAARNDRGSAVLWRAACALSRVTARLTADLTITDVSGQHWPLAEPAVYVANHRSIFDVVAGLLTFAHLQVHPHLVVAEKYFTGAAGRMLEAIGALPAVRGADATIRAATEAVRAGASVAFMPEGRLVEPDAEHVRYGRGAFEVASSTGAPIVPIAGWGTYDVWNPARPRRVVHRRRPRVSVVVGPPIHEPDAPTHELLELTRTQVQRLEDIARHGSASADSELAAHRPGKTKVGPCALERD
jgi:1-acyl-sn-glycerol-3-phosphate acyltransferase